MSEYDEACAMVIKHFSKRENRKAAARLGHQRLKGLGCSALGTRSERSLAAPEQPAGDFIMGPARDDMASV